MSVSVNEVEGNTPTEYSHGNALHAISHPGSLVMLRGAILALSKRSAIGMLRRPAVFPSPVGRDEAANVETRLPLATPQRLYKMYGDDGFICRCAKASRCAKQLHRVVPFCLTHCL